MCRIIWSRSSLRNSRKKRKEKNAFKRRKKSKKCEWITAERWKPVQYLWNFFVSSLLNFWYFIFARPQHALQKLDNNVKCDTLSVFFIRFFLLIVKCGGSACIRQGVVTLKEMKLDSYSAYLACTYVSNRSCNFLFWCTTFNSPWLTLF